MPPGALSDARPCGPRSRHRLLLDAWRRPKAGHRRHSTRGVPFWSFPCRVRAPAASSLVRRQHRAEHQLIQRRQPPARSPHPGTQRRTIQCDALALEHLCLAVERQASRAGEFHPRALPGRVEDWRAGLGRPDHATSPAPSTSHATCGFPALRAPIRFMPRLMGPILLGRLSACRVAPDRH